DQIKGFSQGPLQQLSVAVWKHCLVNGDSIYTRAGVLEAFPEYWPVITRSHHQDWDACNVAMVPLQQRFQQTFCLVPGRHEIRLQAFIFERGGGRRAYCSQTRHPASLQGGFRYVLEKTLHPVGAGKDDPIVVVQLLYHRRQFRANQWNDLDRWNFYDLRTQLPQTRREL